jgi:hypothetical protein
MGNQFLKKTENSLPKVIDPVRDRAGSVILPGGLQSPVTICCKRCARRFQEDLNCLRNQSPNCTLLCGFIFKKLGLTRKNRLLIVRSGFWGSRRQNPFCDGLTCMGASYPYKIRFQVCTGE